MEMNQSLVSVIIPAYNMADWTVEAVGSVLNQTYAPLEVIVVDDGSTDDTRRKLESFNGRVRYIYKENAGASSARNEGIRQARGRYIGLLDCDDLYLPDKARQSVQYLERHPRCGMVFTDIYFIDEGGKVMGRGKSDRRRCAGWVKEKLIVKNLIYNPSVLIRRECFDQAGLFAEDLFPPADWDMWLRISERYQIGYIGEPLSKYRVSSQWNFRNIDRFERENEIVLERFFARNTDVRKTLKNKAYARHYLTMAKYYLVQGQDDRARQYLVEALKCDRLDGMTNAIFLCFYVARADLRKRVAKTLFVNER